ncbi:SWIM zinc finger family protein [Haloplanus rubicundus]|uniref:SWIM zinc finger family protein n=1 Tax=Haloplanus rubicundus TaxID=1547898 RepID=A0A345E1F6_9EURY|nr:SWIM zinc finger family protein [Haloplanus rubicundus]AXG06028.1 SWIM zinc finger family protein [Haloplanus rubicundus]
MASDQHPVDRLDVSPRVLRRAQYEALAFFIRPPYVEVRNYSYPDPENHRYSIGIADGIPINCTCPADVEYARACKHRVGLAIRSKVLDMAIEATVAADGGTVDDVERDAIPADCECHPDDRLPCWPCVEAGRKSPQHNNRTTDEA